MQLATVSRALSLFNLRGTNNLLTVFYQSIGPLGTSLPVL